MGFLHRKLRVFQIAVRFVVAIEGATRHLPRPWWWLRDQTLRSAGSIPLNIAESNAQPGTPQQRRYLRHARDSAAECDACICILFEAGLINETVAADAEDTLNEMSAMLRALIARSEGRDD